MGRTSDGPRDLWFPGAVATGCSAVYPVMDSTRMFLLSPSSSTGRLPCPWAEALRRDCPSTSVLVDPECLALRQ